MIRFLGAASGVALFMIFNTAYSESPVIYPDDPVEFKNQFIRPTYFPDNITKKPGHYTITDWQNAIDSTWGWGLPKAQKLQIFDRVWNKIDSNFACFNGIEVNWDSLRTVYRGEVAAGDSTYGVSRGRFAGIMNYLTVILKESHTVALDLPVNVDTYPDPGVPLLYIGDWNYNWHFGAGLTPLEDSSLLVYKVIENHPLGLVPGDIVLGYDGIAWKDLYPELLEAQLPIRQEYWGSSPSSFTHALLMSAGLNWHLYDSLDVVKFDTGDTLRLATDPLIGLNTEIWCSEQLDIPGVPMPDYNAGERASFGIIESTQIGYVYVNEWWGNVELEFYNAIDSLMHHYQTTGMIIDFRINWGGDMWLSDSALSLLFNEDVWTIDFADRCDPNDHLAMCPMNIPGYYVIPGNPSTYYDKPIAVLTGPGAVSAGDQVALRMKFHPKVKFFGKQTCAAFNGPATPSMSDPDWYFRYAKFDAYLLSNPGHYLTHDEFPSEEYFPGIPFEEVWLTQANVAQGIDDVVEAAINWINSCRYVVGDVNGSESYNGLDITYGVNFFKGGPAPTYECECTEGNTWFVAGDVNGSCNYNGLDITYGVAYFKGGPGPIPCPDCPPE